MIQKIWIHFGLVFVAFAFAGAPDPDYTGLKLGNHWTFSGGSTATIDKVDSTGEGWKYRRVAKQACPYCKEKSPVPDTSWSLVRGDSVFQSGLETDGKWMLAIVLPPKPGTKWISDPVERDTLAWIGKVTARLASGVYANCWKVLGSDSLELLIDQTIGLVRMTQGAVKTELESFQPGNGRGTP